MTRLLLVPFLLLLSSPALGAYPGVDASAVGSGPFAWYDASGQPACRGTAAYAFDGGPAGGVLAWDAPECDGSGSPGAMAWLSHCSDLCFLGCDVRPDVVTCSSSTTDALGRWVWEVAVLRREGSFEFWRYVDGVVEVDGHGQLVVLTWPAG